jgi:hypothetical protein
VHVAFEDVRDDLQQRSAPSNVARIDPDDLSAKLRLVARALRRRGERLKQRNCSQGEAHGGSAKLAIGEL